MKRLVQWLLCAFALCAAAVHAQDIAPAELASAGAGVLKLIDESRFGEVWNAASPVTQQSVPKDKFNAEVARLRQPLGAPAQRVWIQLSRQQVSAGAGSMAGQYLSIEFETRFASGQVKHELVSFRLDDDKLWRVAGYVVR